MATRAKKIRDRIRFVDKESPNKLIYSVMTSIERKLAEETLCLESSDTIAVSSGTATYDEPSNFYRLKLISLPSGQTFTPEEIDKVALDNLQRNSWTVTAQRPYYFNRWEGQITFYPSPNASATYTVYYFRVPSYELGESVDPETPSYMDTALEYGTLADLLPLTGKFKEGDYFRGKFELELQRAISSRRRTQKGIYSISYHDV